MASDLVSSLIAKAAQAPKKQTTIRIDERIYKRLKRQEARWGTSMSEIIEGSLAPVLDELENTKHPEDPDDGEGRAND